MTSSGRSWLVYTNPVSRLRRTPSTTAERATTSPRSNFRRSTSRISDMAATYRRAAAGWLPGGALGKDGPVTVVGFHASHEQVHPLALLDAVQAAEAAGFTAAM